MNRNTLLSAGLLVSSVACGGPDSEMSTQEQAHHDGLVDVLTDAGLNENQAKKIGFDVLAGDSEEYMRINGTRNAIKNSLPDTCRLQNLDRYDDPGFERDRSAPLAKLDSICDKNPLSLTPDLPSAGLVYAFDGPVVNGEKIQFVDLTVRYDPTKTVSTEDSDESGEAPKAGPKGSGKKPERILVIDRALLEDGNERELAQFLLRDAISVSFHPLNEDRVVREQFGTPYSDDQYYASEGFVHNLDRSLQVNFDTSSSKKKSSSTDSSESADLETFELAEKVRKANGRHIEWEMPSEPGVYKLMDESVPHAHLLITKDGEMKLVDKDSGDEYENQRGLTGVYPITKHSPEVDPGKEVIVLYEYIALKGDKIVYLQSNGAKKPNVNLEREADTKYMVGAVGDSSYFPRAESEIDGILSVKNHSTGHVIPFHVFLNII